MLVAYETCLAATGKPPEPRLVRTCCLPVSDKKANIHSHVVGTTTTSVQVILVVFESREAIPAFWSFCSP